MSKNTPKPPEENSAMIKIFISSAQKEFKAERRAIKDFIDSDPLCRRYFDAFLFEDIPARDRNPDAVYLGLLQK